ncbi:PD40 domain-containing protein [candidate division KSB1 bacterium]|nr:PD40 domain-containing protein [candidate division KSB1 bacterium]
MKFRTRIRFTIRWIYVLILLVFTSLTVYSEEIFQIKSGPTPMTAGNFRLFYPTWSPDGKFIAMTGENYRGIWIMDFNGIIFQQLSDDERVGYRFCWSNDSREIACRLIKSTPHQRLKAIKIFDIQTGLNRLVTDFRSGTGFPAWIDNDQKICFMDNEKLRIVNTERNSKNFLQKDSKMTEDVILLETNGRLLLFASHKEIQTIVVNPESRLLNAQLSPNKQKLTFEMANARIYVMNLDGTEMIDLGPGSHPKWAPDGENIVYYISKDDGERIIESDLFMTDIRGEQKYQLTQTDDRIEMHPNWSPDGNKIIFDEYETGIIYLIELEKMIVP